MGKMAGALALMIFWCIMAQAQEADALYLALKQKHEMPRYQVFELAFKGYKKLKATGKIKNQVLSIADFTLSANSKRLWVIDMAQQKVLFHSLVAHGRGSGQEFATHFSNENKSHQSSLGFYITGGLYEGVHGLSLYLYGLQKGLNDNALSRAIVMHGADYVSEDFIQKYGRLGRSYGCPAIPQELVKPMLDQLKNKSCLLLYNSSQEADIEQFIE
ncbi:L,D-transpeptidase catalytic domain [Flexibacter flexilis DSM 6793]|uniref:L,D-transpeptidase catalytic domain n=2 Tax=Flexibacter flexilis TaxID=998 RepID=A0A1I1D7H5_9BACT|nr:L,D-transpeptidase catalytic domain [Flexibacter flexilis DSM 6793]